ncbi:MAG: PaaI family thioesterase [Chloroflexi bacterium]|nr:MAG: aromatic compound degradation protein PaaI [Actinobacteria bacterium 13_1_40CM_66_12]TMF42568.1 MAG: PaaI family thioesterase [Chloroflexota bacterium]
MMEMNTKARTRTITWDDPMTAPTQGAGLSGLEFIRAIFDGKLPSPPITATMGFTGGTVEEGKVTFVGEPGEHLYNPIGVVHGGFAMTLLDSAMGCAVHTTLGVGEAYTTLEAKVNFVRPITLETGPVRCEGTVIHRGGTIATAEGRVIAERTDKLLAHGTTTCLVLKR